MRNIKQGLGWINKKDEEKRLMVYLILARTLGNVGKSCWGYYLVFVFGVSYSTLFPFLCLFSSSPPHPFLPHFLLLSTCRNPSPTKTFATPSHPLSSPLIPSHPLSSPLIPSHPLSSPLFPSLPLSSPLIPSHPLSSPLIPSHPLSSPLIPSHPLSSPLFPSHPLSSPLFPSHPLSSPLPSIPLHLYSI